MANINLLPWRAELKEKQMRSFGILVGLFAAVGVAVGIVGWFILDQAIDLIRADQNLLKNEISTYEAQIKEIETLEEEKSKLLARMDVIQKLQSNRAQTAHVLEVIVKNIPDSIYLDSLEIDLEGKIKISGVSDSKPRLSDFLRYLNESVWVKDATFDNILESIVTNASKNGIPIDPVFMDRRDNRFMVSAKMSFPAPKKTEEESDN